MTDRPWLNGPPPALSTDRPWLNGPPPDRPDRTVTPTVTPAVTPAARPDLSMVDRITSVLAEPQLNPAVSESSNVGINPFIEPMPTIGSHQPQGILQNTEAFVGGTAEGLLGDFAPNTQSIIGKMAQEYDPNIAQTAGNIAGIGASFIPITGGVGKLGQIGKIANLAERTPALLRFAARGAAEGGLWGAEREAMRAAAGEGFDPARMGEEALYGAAGDVALRGLGEYIAKPAIRALRGAPKPELPQLRPRPEFAPPETTGLPPQLESAQLGPNIPTTQPRVELPTGNNPMADVRRPVPIEPGAGPRLQPGAPLPIRTNNLAGANETGSVGKTLHAKPPKAVEPTPPVPVVKAGGPSAPPKPKPITPKPKFSIPVSETAQVTTNKGLARIRKAFNLDALEPTERKAVTESAKKALEKGYDRNAHRIAREALASGRILDEEEVMGLGKRLSELEDDQDALMVQLGKAHKENDPGVVKDIRDRLTLVYDEVADITEAANKTTTRAGRVVNITQYAIKRENERAGSLVVRARELKGGKPLTDKETAKIEKVATEIKDWSRREKELAAKHAKELAENDKRWAEKLVRIESRRTRIRKNVEGKQERIKANLVDLKKQFAELGYRVNTGINPEGLYIIGKMAKAHISLGLNTFDGLAKRITADLPDVTDQDVARALWARSPKAQKAAGKQAITDKRNLKSLSKLLLDIEGEPLTVTKTKKGKSVIPGLSGLQKRLTNLRVKMQNNPFSSDELDQAMQKIDLLQEELANHVDELKAGRAVTKEQVQGTRQRIKDLTKLLDTQGKLADVNQQLQSGEFVVRQVKAPVTVPPELEKARVMLARARKDARVVLQEMQPLDFRKRVKRSANFLRALKATADMSAVFRQGLPLVITRPRAFASAFGKAGGAATYELIPRKLMPKFKNYLEKYSADQIMESIKSSDHHWIRERSKLFLSEAGGTLNKREEFFSSPLLRKFGPTAAAESHYSTFLNLMRVSTFDDFLSRFPNASRDELTAYARYINIATGRGDLKLLVKAGEELSHVFFAPKFAASRIQYPFHLFFSKDARRYPRVRKQMMRDYIGLGVMGASMLSLAHMAGADVDLDPRSSSVGKIRVGNARVDIWAGMQQPMRILLHSLIAASDRTGLTGRQLKKSAKEFGVIDAVGRFAGWKVAPAANLIDLGLSGKTRIGTRPTLGDAALIALAPIVVEGFIDAYRQEGFKTAAWTSGLDFMGVSTQVYKKRKKKKTNKKRGIPPGVNL